MLSIRFEGRIYPTSFHVTFTLPEIEWEDTQHGLIMYFDAKYAEGNVRVDCKINKLENLDHLTTVFARAFDIARTGLDLISFATGRPFTVMLEQYTDPAGKTQPLSLNEPGVDRLCTAYHPGPEYNQVLAIVIGEPPLFYALRELIEAISQPRRPLINCARVIDTLRAQIAPGRERSKGWPELHANLRLTKGHLQFITNHSKDHRHGEYTPVPLHITKEVIYRTWTVMNRFLEFRKRGNQPLPLAEFPLLS